MTLNPNLGRILLGVYLILIGLSGVFGFSYGALSVLVPLLGLAAGVLLVLGR